MDVSDEDQKFIADIYKYSFVGLMLDWIKHDMKEDPKQIIYRNGHYLFWSKGMFCKENSQFPGRDKNLIMSGFLSIGTKRPQRYYNFSNRNK